MLLLISSEANTNIIDFDSQPDIRKCCMREMDMSSIHDGVEPEGESFTTMTVYSSDEAGLSLGCTSTVVSVYTTAFKVLSSMDDCSFPLP